MKHKIEIFVIKMYLHWILTKLSNYDYDSEFLKYLQEVPELLIETCPVVITMTSIRRHSFASSHRENYVQEGMLMHMWAQIITVLLN